MWRILFRVLCLEILIDGFLIYWLFPAQWIHLLKDVLVAVVYFVFLPKEHVKDNMNALGNIFGVEIVVAMAAMFFIGIAQIFNPLSPGLLRGILGVKLMFLPWALIPLAFTYVRDLKDVENFFRLIVLASIPINLFGMVQYSQGQDFMVRTFGPGFYNNTMMAMVPGIIHTQSFVRIIGTFASSAHYAMFLAMNTPLCFGLFFTDRKYKYFWAAILTLNIVTLLCTGSRGGLMAMLFMAGMFAFLSKRARPAMIVIALLVLILYGSFKTLGRTVGMRFATITQGAELRGRTVETAPQQFLIYLNKYPIGRGIGAGSQGARHLGKREGQFFLVENYLSKMQLEVGLPGVLVFYFLIFFIIMKIMRHWIGPPGDSKAYIFSIAMAAFCVAQFTVGTLFSSIDNPPACVFLWVFLGFLAKLPYVNVMDEEYDY